MYKRVDTFLVIIGLMIYAGCGLKADAMLNEEIEYRDKQECFWCGNSDRNILNLYDGLDSIGIINFNHWQISTLELSPEEEQSGGTRINSSGEGGSSVTTDSYKGRRMASARISLGENSNPDLKSMGSFLCEECAGKILEENMYDVGFIDYRTWEIKPIEEYISLTFMGNYAIHVDWNLESEGSNIDLLIFYALDNDNME